MLLFFFIFCIVFSWWVRSESQLLSQSRARKQKHWERGYEEGMGSTAWRNNNIVKWSRLATFNPWALWEARLNMKELPCRLRVLYLFLVSYQQSLVEGRQQVPSDRKGKPRVNTIPLNHKSNAQGHQLQYRWQPPQPVHVKVMLMRALGMVMLVASCTGFSFICFKPNSLSLFWSWSIAELELTEGLRLAIQWIDLPVVLR